VFFETKAFIHSSETLFDTLKSSVDLTWQPSLAFANRITNLESQSQKGEKETDVFPAVMLTIT